MCNLLRAARDGTHLASGLQADRMSNEREQYTDRSALINNHRRKFNRFDRNNEKRVILYSHI